jgi:hypothetical protein
MLIAPDVKGVGAFNDATSRITSVPLTVDESDTVPL